MRRNETEDRQNIAFFLALVPAVVLRTFAVPSPIGLPKSSAASKHTFRGTARVCAIPMRAGHRRVVSSCVQLIAANLSTHNGEVCNTHGWNNSRHPLRWSVSLRSYHAERSERAPSPRVPPVQLRRSLSIRLCAASWSDGVAPNVSAGRHV